VIEVTAVEIRIARGQNESISILIVLLILLCPGLFLEGSKMKITIKNPIVGLISTAMV